MPVVNKCLFPVAGYGTRLLPVTKIIPKEMLPILSKPLIQYGVEEAINAGISTIAMVTNKHKRAIKDYFQAHPEIEDNIQNSDKKALLDEINYISTQCDFIDIEQQEMLGLGHAIYTGQPLIGNNPFAVILSDDLCFNKGDSVLSQIIKIYQQHPNCCIVAIEQVPISEVNKYGVIEGKLLAHSNNTYRVHNMVEKPTPSEAPTNLAIIGRYILTPEIFMILKDIKPDRNGEIQITDALMVLAKKGKVIAHQFKGRRFDCGSVEGLVEANNVFLQKQLKF